MPASLEYIQVHRIYSALRAIGLTLDVNYFEEEIGKDAFVIDYKERRLDEVPIEVQTLYRAVATVWANVDKVQYFVSRDMLRNYSVKFIDSAIACYQCTFRDGALIKQRASYHQSPFFCNYSGNELYGVIDQATGVGLEEYWELFGHKVPCVQESVSFRYDYDPVAFKSNLHPKAHLHLGDTENCRICTEAPPDPRSFFHFIVSKFYPDRLSLFEAYLSDWNGYTKFPSSIHEDEHSFPFFTWGRI